MRLVSSGRGMKQLQHEKYLYAEDTPLNVGYKTPYTT